LKQGYHPPLTITRRALLVRGSDVEFTGESRRLIERGLLAKRRNPHDSRSTLMSVTAAGRRRIHKVVPEVRRVNDLFFRKVSKDSFRHAKRFLGQLLDGSEQVVAHMSKHA